MKSLWYVFCDEIRKVRCDWCKDSEEDLYDFENDIVCRSCLENEEYEDPDMYSDIEKRNAL